MVGLTFSGTATLTNCTFTGNEAIGRFGQGGGARFSRTTTLVACTFNNNSAEIGGGATLSGTGIATLTNCIFTDNEAKSSGGGAWFSGTFTLTSCIFTGNEAEYSGGASFSGTVTLTNCTFTDNEAKSSGGGTNFFGTATLTNCTFTGNKAKSSGGGTSFFEAGTVVNSTFYNNTTDGQGGGLYVTGFPFSLRNSILIDNIAGNPASENQIYLSNQDPDVNIAKIENNLIEGGAASIRMRSQDAAAGIMVSNTVDESDAAVVFASTDAVNANYLHLRAGSPALNAGNNDYLNNGTPDDTDDDITTDAAGNDRIQDGTVDLGAYEGISTVAAGTRTAQTITFTSDTTGTVGTNIELAATASSSLPVTFEITTNPSTGVATLTDDGAGDGMGSLILDGEGTITVTASQAGNADYTAATPVERTITVEAKTALGIEDAVDDLVLYPNPTSDKLHFSEQVEEFLLYSSEGRLLDTWKNVRSADLTALPSGLYFVEVIRGGQSVGYRIVRK